MLNVWKISAGRSCAVVLAAVVLFSHTDARADVIIDAPTIILPGQTVSPSNFVDTGGPGSLLISH